MRGLLPIFSDVASRYSRWIVAVPPAPVSRRKSISSDVGIAFESSTSSMGRGSRRSLMTSLISRDLFHSFSCFFGRGGSIHSANSPEGMAEFDEPFAV